MTLEGHSEAVTCSVMISDTELATAGMDNTIRIWDMTKLAESNTLNGVKAFLAMDYSKNSRVSRF
jgi:WD40 repeat protein